MDDLRKAIGSRLHNLRKLKGLSQKEFSQIMGFSNQQYVSQIEKGVKKPSIESLIRLAKALKVDLNWLLTGKAAETESFLKLIFDMYLKDARKRLAELKEKRNQELEEKRKYVGNVFLIDGVGNLEKLEEESRYDDEISNIEGIAQVLIDRANELIITPANKIKKL